MEWLGLTQTAHFGVFFVMVFGIIVLPGMDMAFVMASALVGGRKAGWAAVAGIVAGGMVHTLMGFVGVGLGSQCPRRCARGCSAARVVYFWPCGSHLPAQSQSLCLYVGGVSPVFTTRLWADGRPSDGAGGDHFGDPNRGVWRVCHGRSGHSRVATPSSERPGVAGPNGRCGADRCRCVDRVARLADDVI
jgi:hypothetical protein